MAVPDTEGKNHGVSQSTRTRKKKDEEYHGVDYRPYRQFSRKKELWIETTKSCMAVSLVLPYLLLSNRDDVILNADDGLLLLYFTTPEYR